MEPIPDFSQRDTFPGTHGNRFDSILNNAERIEKIPALLFALFLLLLAVVPAFGRWEKTVMLWMFFLLDWLLLWLLPRSGRSFGPPRPTVLVLAAARMLFALLPTTWMLPFQAVGTLLVIYGFWIEPHRLTLTRQYLASKKLQPGQPIRVLHLGDLHIERITDRERQLNQLVKELAPDIILFTGDVLNLSYLEDPVAQQHARQVLSAWHAPGGVFAVTGSPAVDLESVFPRLVSGLENLRWLDNERTTVTVQGKSIDLVGITCTHKPFIDGPRLEALLKPASGNFTILLYHSPDLAPNAASTGTVDLQLSGHTHGGQVRLPLFGALYAGSLYGKRFEAGRIALGKLTLYVTRGLGLEGKAAPRVRFLCPPEIILWEIDGDHSKLGDSS